MVRMARCPLCGTENDPTQRSCVACGQLLVPSPPASGGEGESADAGTVAGGVPRASSSATKQTLLGMPSPFAQSGLPGDAAQPAAPQAPAPGTPENLGTPGNAASQPVRTAGGAGKQTLLGFGAIANAPAAPTTPAAPSRPGHEAGQGFAPAAGTKKTLLGVAQPGIVPSSKPAVQQSAPPPVRGGATLLGVARPGVAPTGRAVSSVPQPVPSSEGDLLPGPPPARSGKGLVLVGALAALALGVAAFALWPRSAPKLEVKGLRVGATGDEIVVRCAECADGTRASLGSSAAQFKAGEAVVKTDGPLTVGDHRLSLAITAADGSSSTVQIAVPVAFRARAVLDHLGDDTPSASVEVSAPKGSKVTVAGTQVTLNDQGKAEYALDITKQTTGEDASAVSLAQTLEVSVTPPDGAERRSTVELRAGVTPLVIQAPGPRVVLGGGDLLVSGRTAPGATVRLGDARGKADKDGRFVLPVRAPKPGTFTLHSTGERLATRSLTIEVAGAPSASPALAGYDALRSSLGKRVAVQGKVVDARAQPEGSSLLLEVREGCQSTPCLVGALYPARLVAGMPARDRQLTVVGDVTTGADGNPRIRVETFSSP